jgi:hypothetical protein
MNKFLCNRIRGYVDLKTCRARRGEKLDRNELKTKSVYDKGCLNCTQFDEEEKREMGKS